MSSSLFHKNIYKVLSSDLNLVDVVMAFSCTVLALHCKRILYSS